MYNVSEAVINIRLYLRNKLKEKELVSRIKKISGPAAVDQHFILTNFWQIKLDNRSKRYELISKKQQNIMAQTIKLIYSNFLIYSGAKFLRTVKTKQNQEDFAYEKV